MLLPEIPPEVDASAFLGLGVVGDGAQPALTLVAKCLELDDEIAGANCESLKAYRNDNAVLRIALNQAGLLEIQQQHLANPCGYAGRVGEGGSGGGAVLTRPSGQRALEPLKVPHCGAAEGLKPLLDVKVGRVEQEDAVRGMPVASGAPDCTAPAILGSG